MNPKPKKGYKNVPWMFGKKIEIPEEWELKKIKDLAYINPEQIKDDYKFNEINYIDISSIRNFQVIKIEQFQLKERPSRAQRILQQNDIIVSIVRPYLRAFSLIDLTKSNLVCSTGFSVVRTKNNSVSDFLFNYFQSYIFYQNYFNYMNGMAYPAITSTVVSNSFIFTPRSKNEQQKIASILCRFWQMLYNCFPLLVSHFFVNHRNDLVNIIVRSALSQIVYKMVCFRMSSVYDILCILSMPKILSCKKIFPVKIKRNNKDKTQLS